MAGVVATKQVNAQAFRVHQRVFAQAGQFAVGGKFAPRSKADLVGERTSTTRVGAVLKWLEKSGLAPINLSALHKQIAFTGPKLGK